MLAVLLIISLIALIIATATDIKTREVPDWLNYFLIIGGVGIRALYSVIKWDISFFLYGITGFAIMFIISCIMYYAGQWGGGDSKLLMGLGAMIGFDLKLESPLISFALLIVFIGAIYALVYSLVLAVKNWPSFYKKFVESMKIYNKIRIAVISIAIMLIIVSFFMDFYLKILLLTLAFISYITFYFFIFAKVTEKVCMLKHVDPEKLTEGDWIVNDVIIDKKRICGPKDLGISKEQIKQLIELKKKKKIDKILIKEGIAFVPSFLVAFIMMVIMDHLKISLINILFTNI